MFYETTRPSEFMEVNTKLCSMPRCDKPPRSRQRYCRECHKLYMKAWRAKRRLQEQKLRDSVVRLRSKVVSQTKRIAELEADA